MTGVMAEQGPWITLHQQPERRGDDPAGPLTLVWAFDGTTNAHWRNLFAEAVEKYLGPDHPELPTRARVTEESIVVSGVPRGREDRAWEVVASAVGQANSGCEAQ